MAGVVNRKYGRYLLVTNSHFHFGINGLDNFGIRG